MRTNSHKGEKAVREVWGGKTAVKVENGAKEGGGGS